MRAGWNDVVAAVQQHPLAFALITLFLICAAAALLYAHLKARAADRLGETPDSSSGRRKP